MQLAILPPEGYALMAIVEAGQRGDDADDVAIADSSQLLLRQSAIFLWDIPERLSGILRLQRCHAPHIVGALQSGILVGMGAHEVNVGGTAFHPFRPDHHFLHIPATEMIVDPKRQVVEAREIVRATPVAVSEALQRLTEQGPRIGHGGSEGGLRGSPGQGVGQRPLRALQTGAGDGERGGRLDEGGTVQLAKIDDEMFGTTLQGVGHIGAAFETAGKIEGRTERAVSQPSHDLYGVGSSIFHLHRRLSQHGGHAGEEGEEKGNAAHRKQMIKKTDDRAATGE